MSKGSEPSRKTTPTFYTGELLNEPKLEWLRRSRPDGLGFPCRLPECQRIIRRTADYRQKWYCDEPEDHAAVARKRRKVLAKLIAAAEQRLAELPTNARGRFTTEPGRILKSDLHFLKTIATLYEGPLA